MSIQSLMPLLLAGDILSYSINDKEILVSYDVSALFTNLLLDETIKILVNKASDNLHKEQLIKLIEVATTNEHSP